MTGRQPQPKTQWTRQILRPPTSRCPVSASPNRPRPLVVEARGSRLCSWARHCARRQRAGCGHHGKDRSAAQTPARRGYGQIATARRAAAGSRNQEGGHADGQPVIGQENRLTDVGTIHQRAVGRSQVADHELVVHSVDHAVSATDPTVGQTDVGFRAAANRDGQAVQWDLGLAGVRLGPNKFPRGIVRRVRRAWVTGGIKDGRYGVVS